MKYFLDTEFHEYQRSGVDTIELISIGIVAEDGREFYAVANGFDVDAAWGNAWLKEHVLENLFEWNYSEGPLTKSVFRNMLAAGGQSNEKLAAELREFIPCGQQGNAPQFYGYYADYDWVIFCWLFGRMMDLPAGFPMYCRDLKQMMDEQVEKCEYGEFEYNLINLKARANFPKQENEHNALADARWNKALYEFLREVAP